MNLQRLLFWVGQRAHPCQTAECPRSLLAHPEQVSFHHSRPVGLRSISSLTKLRNLSPFKGGGFFFQGPNSISLGVAQSGRVSGLEPESRGIEALHLDQNDAVSAGPRTGLISPLYEGSIPSLVTSYCGLCAAVQIVTKAQRQENFLVGCNRQPFGEVGDTERPPDKAQHVSCGLEKCSSRVVHVHEAAG